MKRYVGFTEEDHCLLEAIGPTMEPHFPAMAKRFYDQISQHHDAARVMTGGPAQIERLKQTLQHWAQKLFSGPLDEEYAAERYKIGVRHVMLGIPQRFVISSMGLVRDHLQEALSAELRDDPVRLSHTKRALDKMLNLDLNLICDSYFQESIRTLSDLNRRLEQANLELAELSRVKTEFLATTSHELRTPLNSILGFTRLILDGLCETPEEERELQRDVLRSAEHLLVIVNDILDIAKIEAGKLRMVMEPVDLRPIINEAKAVVAVQAGTKHLTIVDETQALPLVMGDRVRVKQILINLVGNAVKFTDQGWITIRAREHVEKGYLELEVQDTGVGIPLEKQRRLFEKFRQIDSSFTRQHGGSGLGLSISRKMVEMMGGRIRLCSAGQGCGTTVTFSLPLRRKTEDPVHVAGREKLLAEGNEKGLRALIVDNDPEFRLYLKTLMTKRGYYVLAAASADDAIDAARRFRPQIVIADMALPERPGAVFEDGADVIAQLQLGSLSREVHCFLVTGYDPADLQERLASLQVSPEVWRKPIDGGKFLERLEQLRRGSEAPTSVSPGAA
jgi:signal transduction histidine kinase/CheY-like chemotaxis protein